VIAHDESRPARQGARAAARARKDEELANATALLRAEYDQARSALGRLWFVERQRLRVKALDAAFQAGAALCALAAATTITVLTVLLLVGSTRRVMAQWTGDAWWSDVVLGVLLVALLAIAASLARRAFHRKALAAAQRHLAQVPAASSVTATAERRA
jgi:hypothetical protein